MCLYTCFAATQVHRPPLGRDGWREADVLMVARNFARHSFPIWQPHIDGQGTSVRVAGMEFPALNYVGGRLASQGVPLEIAVRSLTVACTLLAAGSLYAWVRSMRASATHAAVAALAFLASPLVLRYGQSAQPDMPALALALFALTLSRRAVRPAPQTIRWGSYYASAACMALAAAVKLPVIALGLPAALGVVQQLGMRAGRRWALWGYVPAALAPPWMWYRHARNIQAAQHSAYFNITRSPTDILQDLSSADFYRQWLGQLCDVQACPLVLLAAVVALTAWRKLPLAARGMVVAVVVATLLAGHLGTHHLYYGLPATAALCMLVGCTPYALPKPRILAALMIVVAAWGLWRTRHWFAPPTLDTRYPTALAAMAHIPGPVQLVSHNDPTLLYLVDRCGWADDRVRLNAVAHVIDLRRIGGAELDDFQKRLRATGHTLLHGDALTQIWHRQALR